jgi:hypothetical protein
MAIAGMVLGMGGKCYQGANKSFVVIQWKEQKGVGDGRGWLTRVILATQEAEIRRIAVQASRAKIVRETLCGKTLHKNRAGVAQGEGPEFEPQYRKKKKKSMGLGKKRRWAVLAGFHFKIRGWAWRDRWAWLTVGVARRSLPPMKARLRVGRGCACS